eukprot:1322995-Amphidinium_carterae.1
MTTIQPFAALQNFSGYSGHRCLLATDWDEQHEPRIHVCHSGTDGGQTVVTEKRSPLVTLSVLGNQ